MILPNVLSPHEVEQVREKLDDFTEENGASELIPGSQRFGPGEVPAADDARTLKAIMPAGSVMLWQGPLFHRGGANRTSQTRTGITHQYCQPWLRQIKNMVLAVPPEKAARHSPRVRGLLESGTPFAAGHATDHAPASLHA